MFLTTAATKRPVATSALLLALALLGLNSYRKLSLENLPSVDVPYVTVTTIWPGASSEDVEKDVAKRIEDAVSGVEGLKHTYSTCFENAGNTIVEFAIGTDVDVAAQDVREKIDAIVGECLLAREKNGAVQVALTGGTFQNKILMEGVLARLRELDFTPYYNISVSPNDGGIALGQAFVALHRD